MLEIKDLYKVYKPKKGVPVVALNKVSLKFPDTGMVFLLGKSGSGKSTMLNLLGGLDSYNDGEIIIKGVSSRNFKQKHFDSYRNTYVGFIFQEYNILEEFSVGANIALALELQGQKATDERINEILTQVDLEGYGNRKPNELSGGQKQRVAIARALIKNPEIIMADEPTGALDSNTGKQVFDTLKKLSKEKLIIIVSHDREFSEQYADRIIELADGSVISDVELDEEGSEDEEDENSETVTSVVDENGQEISVSSSLTFAGNNIAIEPGYHLTDADRQAINAYMDSLEKNETLILTKKVHRYRNVQFKPTDESRIKHHDGSDFKLIKSKLPMKDAFKIGASGLKYKKFKLVMTILLSCVAFILFGLADTFGAYNHAVTCAESIHDSKVNYATFRKEVRVKYDEDEDEYYWQGGYKINDKDLAKIEKDTGIKVTGLYLPDDINTELHHYNREAKFTEEGGRLFESSYAFAISGLTEISEKDLEKFRCKLVAGKMPDGTKNEIAISTYLFETYHIGGYAEDLGATKFEEIKEYKDMVGKKLTFGNRVYTVTGIIDTGFDMNRYKLLNEKSPEKPADLILHYALSSELEYAKEYSMICALMVGPGFVEKEIKESVHVATIKGWGYIEMNGYADDVDISVRDASRFITMEEINRCQLEVLWVDGEKKTLGENEIIIPVSNLHLNGGTSDFETAEDVLAQIKKTPNLNGYGYIQNAWQDNVAYKIVGIIPDAVPGDILDNDSLSPLRQVVAVSDALMKKLGATPDEPYVCAIGAMPAEERQILPIVKYSYDESGDTVYRLQNSVIYELDIVNEILQTVSKVFLFIGIGFAFFAALMLSNFIAVSISYKKQEIGILRAIGSRGNDVFRIFFSESFIIAMINFVIAGVGVGGVTAAVNYAIRSEAGLLITVLHFGIRQIGLIFVVSLVVAALASFIPVKKIASKKPIDAIRNR